MTRNMQCQAAMRWATVLVGLMVVFSLGCNRAPITGSVKGNVTFNEKPYTNAAVVFVCNETGKAGTANIQPDGTFKLEEPLPIGRYVVYLAPALGNLEGAGPEKAMPVKMDEAVPPKYWDEAASGIVVEVKEGENDVPVTLTK